MLFSIHACMFVSGHILYRSITGLVFMEADVLECKILLYNILRVLARFV